MLNTMNLRYRPTLFNRAAAHGGRDQTDRTDINSGCFVEKEMSRNPYCATLGTERSIIFCAFIMSMLRLFGSRRSTPDCQGLAVDLTV